MTWEHQIRDILTVPSDTVLVDLFDALVERGVVVFRFGLLSLEIIVTVLALTAPGRR